MPLLTGLLLLTGMLSPIVTGSPPTTRRPTTTPLLTTTRLLMAMRRPATMLRRRRNSPRKPNPGTAATIRRAIIPTFNRAVAAGVRCRRLRRARHPPRRSNDTQTLPTLPFRCEFWRAFAALADHLLCGPVDIGVIRH